MIDVVSYIFIFTFILCGCSLDGFFDGNAPMTLFCLFVTMVCGYIICSQGKE